MTKKEFENKYKFNRWFGQAFSDEIWSDIENEIRLARPQWINVKERLPELDKRILVYVKDYHIDRDQTNTDKILFGYLRGSGKIRPDGCLGDFNVTHWMPLPEPPTTEKK